MAESIDYETREYAVHHISCDECGEHICDSEEYDDGYYDDPSEYIQQIYVEGKNEWYKMEKHLCKKCKEKFTNELINNLVKIGFTKDL